MKIDPNEVWLAYVINVFIAKYKALWRCSFNWDEQPCDNTSERGRINFVGTCTGEKQDNNIKVIKTYYGDPPENPNRR